MGYSPWGHKESDATEHTVDLQMLHPFLRYSTLVLKTSQLFCASPHWSSRLCTPVLTGKPSKSQDDANGRWLSGEGKAVPVPQSRHSSTSVSVS